MKSDKKLYQIGIINKKLSILIKIIKNYEKKWKKWKITIINKS